MLTLRDAIKIVEKEIPMGHSLLDSYGEAQGKYVFTTKDARGCIPPGGFHWTVNKETGECKCEGLEREGNKPFSPILGYRKLSLEQSPVEGT